MDNTDISQPDPRPVLLLDFDGVINIHQRPELAEVRLLPHLPGVRLYPDIGHWLMELDKAYQIVWCSHWGRLLQSGFLDALGIGARPYLVELPEDASLRDWKWRAASRFLEGRNNDCVWLEDGFGRDARKWSVERETRGARTRLYDVSEGGLTPEIANELLKWARPTKS